jgi:hypothetical protein
MYVKCFLKVMLAMLASKHTMVRMNRLTTAHRVSTAVRNRFRLSLMKR